MKEEGLNIILQILNYWRYKNKLPSYQIKIIILFSWQNLKQFICSLIDHLCFDTNKSKYIKIENLFTAYRAKRNYWLTGSITDIYYMELPVVGRNPPPLHIAQLKFKGLDLKPVDIMPNCCLIILTSTTPITPVLHIINKFIFTIHKNNNSWLFLFRNKIIHLC